MSKDNNNGDKEKFASRLGFILVSAGCAIGLGNVWKFPYICGQNGGAIFIVIYILFLLLLGYPILTCEFAIGRGSGKSVGSALRELAPPGGNWHKFSWYAYAGNYLLMMFYTMVAGWMVYYVYVMGSGQLHGEAVEVIEGRFSEMLASPGLMAVVTLAVIACCIGICSLGLQNGVERVTKVMMIALIILMIVMAVNSLMLSGNEEGLKFYLVPSIERANARGWGNVLFDAMTQAFFTLSVGMGSMEIFGSCIGKEHKLSGEAKSVMYLDTFVALMAGVIILPACFAYGISPDKGPSLLFMTLPNVFNHMPGGRVWGVLFFIFMSFAALSTVIAVFENIISISIDMFGWKRKKSLIINLIGISVLSMPAVLGFNILSKIAPMGAGSNIMDLEDFLVSNNILPLGSLLFVLFCTRKNGWGFDNFVAEADAGIGKPFPRYLRKYMSYVLPLIIVVIYFKGYYDTFAPKGTLLLCIWMCVALLFVLFIGYLAFGHSRRDGGGDVSGNQPSDR